MPLDTNNLYIEAEEAYKAKKYDILEKIIRKLDALPLQKSKELHADIIILICKIIMLQANGTINYINGRTRMRVESKTISIQLGNAMSLIQRLPDTADGLSGTEQDVYRSAFASLSKACKQISNELIKKNKNKSKDKQKVHASLIAPGCNTNDSKKSIHAWMLLSNQYHLRATKDLKPSQDSRQILATTTRQNEGSEEIGSADENDEVTKETQTIIIEKEENFDPFFQSTSLVEIQPIEVEEDLSNIAKKPKITHPEEKCEITIQPDRAEPKMEPVAQFTAVEIHHKRLHSPSPTRLLRNVNNHQSVASHSSSFFADSTNKNINYAALKKIFLNCIKAGACQKKDMRPILKFIGDRYFGDPRFETRDLTCSEFKFNPQSSDYNDVFMSRLTSFFAEIEAKMDEKTSFDFFKQIIFAMKHSPFFGKISTTFSLRINDLNAHLERFESDISYKRTFSH